MKNDACSHSGSAKPTTCPWNQKHVPVNAMLPADEDIDPPQAHQHGVPVVVVAQERGDEEGQEDGHRAGEE